MAPKRKKTIVKDEDKRATTRARKGKLEALPDMPLDILYEVSSDFIMVRSEH